MQNISWKTYLIEPYCNDVKFLQYWKRLKTFFMDIFSTLSITCFSMHIWTAASTFICLIFGLCRIHFVKSVQIRSFSWSVFYCIRTEYGDLLSKSLYSVQEKENTGQKKLRVWTLSTQWFLYFRKPRKPMISWRFHGVEKWKVSLNLIKKHYVIYIIIW